MSQNVWDFKRHHVQKFDNNEVASQLGSKAILISVGPPTWQSDGHAVVMGFVQNLSLQQQRQIMEIFEIGSERRYFAQNPTRNQVQMSRILYSGASILTVIKAGILNRGLRPGSTLSGGAVSDRFFTEGDLNAASTHPESNLTINLASDLFNNPLGIMLQFREFHGDGRSTEYGTVYLEVCQVQGHGFQSTSQTWLLQEDVSLLFENIVPIGRGSRISESHRKRAEIMNSLGTDPGWFQENFEQWTGVLSGAATQ